MKRIILVRHGKAEDPASGITDFERSLTVKGKVISGLIAKKLREIEKSRVVIISSPAFRAVETALIFAGVFGVEPSKIKLNSTLYYKMNLRYIPEILSLASEDTDTVVMFGHNPSFTEIANSLCQEGCDFMPKSGVAGIVFDCSKWTDIKQKKGKLDYFLTPETTL